MRSSQTGWRSVRVGDIMRLQRRNVTVDLDGRYEEIGIRSFGKGIFHKSPIDGLKIANKRVFRINRGDLVLSNVFAWEGAIAVAGDEESGKIGSHRFMTYTVDPDAAVTDYLRYFFLSDYGMPLINDVSPGGAGRNRTLGIRAFEDLSIPLPPISVQRLIVRTLTATDETVKCHELLVDKLQQVYQGIAQQFVSDLSASLGSRVGDHFKIMGGVTLGPDRTPRQSPKPYLRVANVRRGRIDLDDVALVEVSPGEYRRLALYAGDLLVVEGHANPSEIGRCALVGSDAQGLIYQNHLFRLRGLHYVPEFTQFWLNSDFAVSYWRRIAATSSGLYTINANMIAEMPFPTVSQDEQRHVVRALASVEVKIEALAAKLAKLRLIKQGLTDELLSGESRVPAHRSEQSGTTDRSTV